MLGLFDIDSAGQVPLFPSERHNTDSTCMRATADVFRRSLADAAEQHLPEWGFRTGEVAYSTVAGSVLVPPGRTAPCTPKS